MKSSNNTPEDYYMFTDYWRAKDIIWESYVAFIEHYSVYIMYRSTLNRKNRIVRSGLVRYADYLYHEIRSFVNNGLKNKFQESDIDRLNKLFSTFDDNFSDDDFLFLRNFFDDFMVLSGLKSILATRDNRPAVTQAMSKRYKDVDFDIGGLNNE